MNESLKSNDFTPPPWLVRTCQWFWAKLRGWRSFVLGTCLTTLLCLYFFTPISQLPGLYQSWAFENKYLLLSCFLALDLITLFIGFISQSEITPPMSARKRHYLLRRLQESEQLSSKGIAQKFFPQSIKLDEVFIPLKLKNERTLTDYPLREEEIPVWRRIFAKRKKRLPHKRLPKKTLKSLISGKT
jgi:hypothetical protein